MWHTENPGMVKTVCSGIFRHIQEHSVIFSHVQVYWGTFRHYWVVMEPLSDIFGTLRNRLAYTRRATWRERWSLPALSEIEKKSWFGKKKALIAHLWVKFAIENVVLSVSSRKNTKMVPCGASFSCIFDPLSYPTTPEEFLAAHLH